MLRPVMENELVSLRRGDDDLKEEDNDEGEEQRLLQRKPTPVMKQPTEDDLLLESSLVDDIIAALNDAKFIAPVIAFVVLLVGMYMAIQPFHPHSVRTPRLSHDEFKDIRPVLSVEEMADIYVSTFYGETNFKLPEPWYDNVALKFSTTADRHGHHQPPELFFGGVVYGISASNPHNIEYSANRRRLQESVLLDDLRAQLKAMVPSPTAIFERTTQNNDTSFTDRGYGVYFSLEDLEKQGMLSSDSHEPWKRTLDPVLKVARDHRQVYITQWYPKKFGRQDVAAVMDSPHRHETVVRQVIPTRTGLNNIKSTGAVWLMLTNFSAPKIVEAVIQKEWTEDDHWTHYPLEDTNVK